MTDPLLIVRLLLLLGVANGMPVLARKVLKDAFAAPVDAGLKFVDGRALFGDSKTIRGIIERTGVKIDVEDDGRVNVASADETSAKKAISIIQELTATPELNKTYLGKIQRITDFGAFVEIIPGTDGLLHVSEIANHRVKDVRDELKEGEQILVKVINIDPTGKIRLSRKALLTEEAGAGKK